MDISIEILEHVKKYVNGELSQDELGAFEQLLKAHPELQEEVDFAKSLVGATELVERERLLKMIQDVEAGKVIQIPILKRRKHWMLAATFIGLLFIFLSWFNQNRANDNYETFLVSSYQKPAISDSWRGDPIKTQLSTAHRAYQSENYQESLNNLESVSAQDSLYFFALFLKGHNYYKLKNFEQAINTFNELKTTQNQALNYKIPSLENAEWTKILCLLAQWKNSKTAEKKQLLENTLDGFIMTADPLDIYYENAIEMKELLQTSLFLF